MARDRLDHSKRGSILYELFTLPGRTILWVKYMNPGKGYKGVRKSSRHARSPIMTFLYSLVFWFLAAFIAFLFLCTPIEDTGTTDTPTNTPIYENQPNESRDKYLFGRYD